VLVINSSVILT